MNSPKIEYYKDGKIYSEFYYINGKYHRADGPAKIQYYKNGKTLSEHYYLNGKRHRVGNTATTFYEKDGTICSESYYLSGKLYREKGPAVIYYRDGNISSEYYYLNDEPHRVDGPAIIDSRRQLEFYYIEGNKYSEQEYTKLINDIKQLPEGVRLTDKRKWVREFVPNSSASVSCKQLDFD